MQKVRLVSSLRYPERADWSQDPGFDASVHERLLAASLRIRQSTPAADHCAEAEVDLLELQSQPMAPRQSMLLYYLLAQCARAHDITVPANFAHALEWCNRAEHIAAMLLDFGAQVDLHELRGTLHRAISIFWVAAEEFSLALRLMREHAEDMESFDPELEVTLAAKAATLDYLLGNFARALEHIRRADALLPLTEQRNEGEGTIAWAFALLYRQRNEPVEALRYIKSAAALYRTLGAINSTCRALSLAADIALDIVESPLGEAADVREEHLAVAADYIEEALRVGREANDRPGIELARLSLARRQRAQGVAGSETEALIRSVMRQARTMRDDALLAAAHTELGVELVARGELAAGKRWLNRATGLAERMGAPGLAFRAQRILRQMEGRNA